LLNQSSKDSLSKLAKIFNEAAIKYSNKEAEKNAQLPGAERTKKRANTIAAPPGVPKNAPTPGAATR
jgi:hypothetical protein